jgi:hypothetical protein
MTLLQIQHTLYKEAEASGRTREPRWYNVEFLSSDFTLAALILCLELQFERDEETEKSETAGSRGHGSTTNITGGSPCHDTYHLAGYPGLLGGSSEGI